MRPTENTEKQRGNLETLRPIAWERYISRGDTWLCSPVVSSLRIRSHFSSRDFGRCAGAAEARVATSVPYRAPMRRPVPALVFPASSLRARVLASRPSEPRSATRTAIASGLAWGAAQTTPSPSWKTMRRTTEAPRETPQSAKPRARKQADRVAPRPMGACPATQGTCLAEARLAPRARASAARPRPALPPRATKRARRARKARCTATKQRTVTAAPAACPSPSRS
jgi:hypothetical protein